MDKREIAIKVAWSMLGLPYIWGGDDMVGGFDCSGMVIEVLKSVGALPRKGDWPAAGLFEYFKDKEVATPYEGCLVFWRGQSSVRIIHVEFCISPTLSIGASGGGSATMSAADAIKQNAYIKIRPWETRLYVAGFVDPFLGLDYA